MFILPFCSICFIINSQNTRIWLSTLLFFSCLPFYLCSEYFLNLVGFWFIKLGPVFVLSCDLKFIVLKIWIAIRTPLLLCCIVTFQRHNAYLREPELFCMSFLSTFKYEAFRIIHILSWVVYLPFRVIKPNQTEYHWVGTWICLGCHNKMPQNVA
jgi:hypothetical protein